MLYTLLFHLNSFVHTISCRYWSKFYLIQILFEPFLMISVQCTSSYSIFICLLLCVYSIWIYLVQMSHTHRNYHHHHTNGNDIIMKHRRPRTEQHTNTHTHNSNRTPDNNNKATFKINWAKYSERKFNTTFKSSFAHLNWRLRINQAINIKQFAAPNYTWR